MLRLPQGVTWPMLVAFVVVIVGGMWTSKQWSERQRLLSNLAAYAKAHPAHAAVTQVVISCARRIIPDHEKCGEELLSKFGPEVLNTLGQMQQAGAFGVPLQPGKE